MKIPVTSSEKHVAIIGGGIAGLSAAWYLQQQGVEYTLLEASDRFGGLLKTVKEDGFVMEFGPDAFITRKPWAYELAQELGLGDDILAVNDTPERIYVLVGDQLAPLPDGLRLLVPTNIQAFLASPLMTWGGKLRLLMDNIIPPKPDDKDESLADFVVRRMGREALDRLADPLLAGVYNAEMHKQSILATFPQYRQLEKKYGGLIRGMTESLKNAPESEQTTLISFRHGIGQLVDTLLDQLTGTLKRNCAVVGMAEVHRGYTLTLENGDTLTVDGVIVATPANVAARFLYNVAPVAAKGLTEIRYAGIGSISMAFDAEDVPRPLDAYGVVIPSSAGRNIDGMQWSSSKWKYRAPEGKVLIRIFFGGPHTRHMLSLRDAELMPLLREEVRQVLGITAKPLRTALDKWDHAYPQYDVGHIELVDGIMRALPDDIKLVGNTYRGVGVPDTIHGAKQAAAALARYLDVNSVNS